MLGLGGQAEEVGPLDFTFEGQSQAHTPSPIPLKALLPSPYQ